jgi:hypothetical protein
VTREHVRTYRELAAAIVAQGAATAETIEDWADDLLISRAGTGRPRIDRLGVVPQCPSYRQSGVAIHSDPTFSARREAVARAVAALRPWPGIRG